MPSSCSSACYTAHVTQPVRTQSMALQTTHSCTPKHGLQAGRLHAAYHQNIKHAPASRYTVTRATTMTARAACPLLLHHTASAVLINVSTAAPSSRCPCHGKNLVNQTQRIGAGPHESRDPPGKRTERPEQQPLTTVLAPAMHAPRRPPTWTDMHRIVT